MKLSKYDLDRHCKLRQMLFTGLSMPFHAKAQNRTNQHQQGLYSKTVAGVDSPARRTGRVNNQAVLRLKIRFYANCANSVQVKSAIAVLLFSLYINYLA